MKKAHIVTAQHEVGDRVLALCGRDRKITVLWDDIPREQPICRDCVDVALGALDDADVVITRVRLRVNLLTRMLTQIVETITPEEGLIVDTIAELNDAYVKQRQDKADRKADRKRAQQTCTCTWPGLDLRETDPDCPIHGHGPDQED